MTRLPNDFKEFLRSLNSHGVEYLLVGGYAVGYYGYPRATADMDIWVSPASGNAKILLAALNAFGFKQPELTSDALSRENQIIRMGVPPLRIEILTSITGVRFENAYARRRSVDFDGIPVSLIGLEDLKENKRACGRHKDMDDLEHLG
jgi:predicted nucleotidyltransferase